MTFLKSARRGSWSRRYLLLSLHRSFADAWYYVPTGRPFRIPTRCTRPRTVKSSARKNRRRWKPHVQNHTHASRRVDRRRDPATYLRRSPYVVNNIDIMQSSRWTTPGVHMHSLTLLQMHAHMYVHVRFAFARMYAYHGKALDATIRAT